MKLSADRRAMFGKMVASMKAGYPKKYRFYWKLRKALRAKYAEYLENLKKNPLPRPKNINRVDNKKLYGKRKLENVLYIYEKYHMLKKGLFKIETEMIPKFSKEG